MKLKTPTQLGNLIDNCQNDREKRLELIEYICELEQIVKQHRAAIKHVKKGLEEITR